MLQHIKQEWVLVWVDDFLLCNLVDTPRVYHLIENAQKKGATSLLLHATNSQKSIIKAAYEIEQIPVSASHTE